MSDLIARRVTFGNCYQPTVPRDISVVHEALHGISNTSVQAINTMGLLALLSMLRTGAVIVRQRNPS